MTRPKAGYYVKKTTYYNDISFDRDGWADATVVLPIEYEMVELRISGRSTQPGWWNGGKWDGARIKPYEIVTHWRRNDKYKSYLFN